MATSIPPRRPSNPGRPAISNPNLRAVVEIKLLCKAGPAKGEEYPVSKDEAVIGRAAEADVCLPDTSVSRRHARLFKRDGQWMVADLGSGNGTLLNNEAVHEYAIHHNDVLTLGETTLVFMDVANVTDRAMIPLRASSPGIPRRPTAGGQAPTRMRPRMGAEESGEKGGKRGLLIGVSLVFLIVMGGVVVMSANRKEKAKEAAKEQRMTGLSEKFQAASAQIRDNHWKDAKVLLQEIAAADANYPGLQDMLERSDHEIPNQDLLEQAQKKLEQNHLGPSAALLAKVSKDTVMIEAVAQIRTDLEKKAASQVLAARKALDDQKLQEAFDIASDVLVAFPEQRDAKAIAEEATRKLTEPPPGLGPLPKPWDQAVAKYRSGDIDGAIASATACAKFPRCAGLVKEISEAAALHKKMDTLTDHDRARLEDLNRSISEGKASPIGSSTKASGAQVLAKQAQAAKAAGDLGKAAKLARDALDRDPNSAVAKAIIQEAHEKAHEVYLNGYSLAPSDPPGAIKIFKEVLLMTDPSDEYHQKAQHQIDKLKQ